MLHKNNTIMSIGGKPRDQKFFEISVVRLSQSFEVFLAIKCFLLVFTYNFYVNFIDALSKALLIYELIIC